jgi:hemoglobin-like flavoprotein
MPLDTQILKASFEEIKPVATEVVDHFYNDLFKRHPDSKQLFNPSRMEQQKTSLIQALVTIFDNIEKPQDLEKYLKQLGKRHVRYGVQSIHYEWVADSLLKTLQYFFDDTWTTQLEDAWMTVLGLISETMRSGAADEGAPASAPVRSPIEHDMKNDIEVVLKELMYGSIEKIATENEMKELAANQARALIKEALQEELNQLKSRFKVVKDAA